MLPKEVKTKIYKTGQTRGADDDVIFQNRVGRNSTVLIPYEEYSLCNNISYENGFIVLIKPEIYFREHISDELKAKGLTLGQNLLVFYETRKQWDDYPILSSWSVANSRTAPLGGEYVARVPKTTASGSSKIIRGYSDTSCKGAGIRVYEYSSKQNISDCKLQLEVLFWHCYDALDLIISLGIGESEAKDYIAKLEKKAQDKGLFDYEKLHKARIIDKDGFTICPLCLEKISSKNFCKRIEQAEGRDVPDLTVTETSLFHINELRIGQLNHRPYNLGWGHHHCNVVVKDSGIEKTIQWMQEVLKRNLELSK